MNDRWLLNEDMLKSLVIKPAALLTWGHLEPLIMWRGRRRRGRTRGWIGFYLFRLYLRRYVQLFNKFALGCYEILNCGFNVHRNRVYRSLRVSAESQDIVEIIKQERKREKRQETILLETFAGFWPLKWSLFWYERPASTFNINE